MIPYNACRFLSTNKDDIVVTERLSDAKGKRAACLAKIYLIYLKMQIMRELLVMKNFWRMNEKNVPQKIDKISDNKYLRTKKFFYSGE